ncbi:MAG: hypothetical protein WCD13_20850, partial [Pseudolabrys sp.]
MASDPRQGRFRQATNSAVQNKKALGLTAPFLFPGKARNHVGGNGAQNETAHHELCCHYSQPFPLYGLAAFFGCRDCASRQPFYFQASCGMASAQFFIIALCSAMFE